MKNPLLCYNKHKKSFKQLIKGEEWDNGTGTSTFLPNVRRTHRAGTALLCQLRPILCFSTSSGRERSRHESTAIDTISANFATSIPGPDPRHAIMAQYRAHCACLSPTFLHSSSQKASLRQNGLCTYKPAIAYPFGSGQLSWCCRSWHPLAWPRRWERVAVLCDNNANEHYGDLRRR